MRSAVCDGVWCVHHPHQQRVVHHVDRGEEERVVPEGARQLLLGALGQEKRVAVVQLELREKREKQEVWLRVGKKRNKHTHMKHTHAHTHTHTRAHTHTHTHARTHARARARTHARTHTHTHTRTRTRVNPRCRSRGRGSAAAWRAPLGEEDSRRSVGTDKRKETRGRPYVSVRSVLLSSQKHRNRALSLAHARTILLRVSCCLARSVNRRG